MSRILILEDDPVLGAAISLQLEVENYAVTWAQNLFSAKEIVVRGEVFDLFILDINLPDGTGFDFCRWIREQQNQTPVIFLTAKVDEDSVVQGFNLGANDYIRKPFGKQEFLARLRNQISEKRTPEEGLKYCELTLLTNQQAMKYKDALISLNRREFELLLAFFERPESVITREMLMNKISSGDEIFDRTIDSHISHIRAKFRRHKIENYKISSVYGSGYRLEKGL